MLLWMLATLLVIITISWVLGARPVEHKNVPVTDKTLLDLSGKLLYAVKLDESPDSVIIALAAFSVSEINKQLSDDGARKTFWINLYNAWYQILATRDKLSNPEIFRVKAIRFNDAAFSLDDVEHGILRKYRWKYSLGYLPQFLPNRIIKKLAVQNIDYRIHFALNCGAKSCPPIAFYAYENIDVQLEVATRSFLINESEIDHLKKEAHVTRIMYWFKADFGGNKGIRSILAKYLDQNVGGYKIQFKNYDWSEDLKNFTP